MLAWNAVGVFASVPSGERWDVRERRVRACDPGVVSAKVPMPAPYVLTWLTPKKV
jgi:hypothetical protein